MKLSVVMPCYMEADNLKKILPALDDTLIRTEKDSEVLVIDTVNSMDTTEEICRELEVSLKTPIRYIHRRNGNNYGDAIRTGLEDATGEYIVVMDADGSHNPKDIVRLYKTITDTKCGVVIGSRYTKGGDTDNPFVLKFMSYVLNVSYRLFFHLDVKDVSDSYRIYDADVLKKINLKCDNFDIVEEILIKIRDNNPNLEIKEIPIIFNKREFGQSKRNLFKFVLSYLLTMVRLKKIQKG